MTRIVIPIPEHETLAFEFKYEREDGLVEFQAETTEAHIVAFRKVDEGIDEHFWSQGAVVASLTKKYGEKGPAMEQMSAAVELSTNYLRTMARTYRTFKYVPRDTSLSFSHHKAAARHSDPAKALTTAKANGWSKNQLEEWVSQQSLRSANKATRKAKSEARNSWREHVLHMDEVIAGDFIKNSPNQEYARRVCGEWRQELADELKQLEILDNQDLIVNAIDERGAGTLKAIRKDTGIDSKEIARIVARLVEDNIYEWVDRFALGRGQAEQILHKVGEVDGSAFSMPRSEYEYTH